MCVLTCNAADDPLLDNKSLPEVLQETQLLYGGGGSVASQLIQGLSDIIQKVDPATAAEVKTNMNSRPVVTSSSSIFPLHQKQILDSIETLVEELKDTSADHEARKKVAVQLVYLNEVISDINKLNTEVLLKLYRSMSKENENLVSHVFYPFMARANWMQQIITIRTQRYIAQEL